MAVTALNLTPEIFIKPGADITAGIGSNDHKVTAVAEHDIELNNKMPDKPIKEEQIHQAIDEVNKTLAPHNTRLEFSVHDKTKAIMVKVVDEKTGETIREVPPKRVLDMVAMAWDEMGLLVDEKA